MKDHEFTLLVGLIETIAGGMIHKASIPGADRQQHEALDKHIADELEILRLHMVDDDNGDGQGS